MEEYSQSQHPQYNYSPSSSSSFKHKLKSYSLEITDMWCYVISKVAHRRRRSSSADFSYDPLSYALNFDDGACADVASPSLGRSFSVARATTTVAPTMRAVPEGKEIACA